MCVTAWSPACTPTWDPAPPEVTQLPAVQTQNHDAGSGQVGMQEAEPQAVCFRLCLQV